MEQVFCNVHSNQACFLKTGIKDGSQKGKSFYVCSHKGECPCSFTRKADAVQALDCPVHHGNTIELQMIHTSQSKQQKRLYYRCLKKSGAFCGFRVVEDNVAKGVTNVLKVKNGSSLSVQPKKPSFLSPPTDAKTPEKSKQLLDFGEIARSAGARPRPVSKLTSSLNDSGYRHKKKDSDSDSDDDCFVVDASKPNPPQPTVRPKPTSTLALKESQPPVAPQAVKVASTVGATETTAPSSEVKDPKQSAETLIRQFKHSVENRSQRAKELQQKKAILSSVAVNMLPDGGKRLQSQITELSSHLAQLDIQIRKDRDAVAQLPNVVMRTQPAVLKPIQPVVRRTVSGQILPEGARQLKLTDHYSALASQDYQRMLAAHPQMEALYGGRMTQARLRQVGQVTDEALESLHKQLDSCPAKEDEVDDPNGLMIPLMTHQRQALAWLSWREAQSPAGGILADDMGLGKTLTMISFILLQRQRGDDNHKDQVEQSSLIHSKASLIVAPASLIYQWSNEIKRRCRPKTLKVVMHHGPQRETNPHKLSKADIVLTTYEIVRREAGLSEAERKNKALYEMPAADSEGVELEKQPGLLRIAWQRVILDEAHSIKNHKSQTAVAICRLRALSRWALTGTPIQNTLLDIYSLIRFLRCSPFDEYKVWKRQVDNTSAKSQKRLQLLVKTLLLRRTKDETDNTGKKLIALPEKKSQTHELSLSSDERKVYDKIYQQSRSVLQDYLQRQEDKEAGIVAPKETNNPWASKDGKATESGQAVAGGAKRPGHGQILLLLLRLRQCCSHLSLMKAALETESLVDGDGLQLDLVEQMQDLALEEGSTEEPSATQERAFQTSTPSSKILAVMEEVRTIRANSPKGCPMKSVIVSQWTSMLDIMEQHLKAEGFRCATIKGSIKPEMRADLVDQFNSDPKGFEVMLVSLRAGGVGLNLIGGNHLFIIDLHWNPALEQQAADRIYRVGQTKDVFIHRFICQETIEEKISKLQEGKMALAKNVLAGGAATSTKLTLDDLKSLFDLHQPVQGATGFF